MVGLMWIAAVEALLEVRLGIILLLRKPRKGGEGVRANAYFCLSGGRGGLTMAYVSIPQFEFAEQNIYKSTFFGVFHT